MLVVGFVTGYPLEHGWINHFLDPVLGAPAHGTGNGLPESVLIGISVLAGVGGFVIALVMLAVGVGAGRVSRRGGADPLADASFEHGGGI